jgi:leader peptidase (prepilin peptidase)/N-methyltransferase
MLFLPGAGPPDPLIAATAAVLGACLGSFANVLVYRLPRNLNWAAGRSFCPVCHRHVRWHDNVPVLGWLLLRGRCRDCGAPISPRYPLVELAGAAGGVLALWRFGPGIAGAAALVFLLDLLVVACVDWEHMIIPHTLTVGGIACGLGLASWSGQGLLPASIGCLAGAGIVVALAQGYRLVRGQAGMGGGDVMLMAMVGAFLGPWGVGLVLFGGAVLGTLYVLVRHRGSLPGTARLPFGTFLAAAGALALLAGGPLVSWYLARLA